MTKQNLIALADTLRRLTPLARDGNDAMTAWRKTVFALADFCASQNPRFNRDRWIGYVNGTCGPNGGSL